MIAAPAAITTRTRRVPVTGNIAPQRTNAMSSPATADIRKYSPDPAETIPQTGTV
jgi:hypothetical protein